MSKYYFRKEISDLHEKISKFHFFGDDFFSRKGTCFEIFTHIFNSFIFENYHIFFIAIVIKNIEQYNWPINKYLF